MGNREIPMRIFPKSTKCDLPENDREMYMKGIDHSYYYEGYTEYKTEKLKG